MSLNNGAYPHIMDRMEAYLMSQYSGGLPPPTMFPFPGKSVI